MRDYKDVILASASPRRQELLKLIFDEFRVIPANIDESMFENIHAEQRPLATARAKAKRIAAENPQSLVIGCDTAVIADREVLGKPEDSADAVRMLRLLSDSEHKVITGVCLILGENEMGFSVETRVRFFPLKEIEIAKYIETGEWTDKAGAYGIQGAAGLFVAGITGDYNNVVGLPCALLNRKLREFLGK